MKRFTLGIAMAVALAGCDASGRAGDRAEPRADAAADSTTHDRFLGRLHALCGQAFEGEMVEGTPDDTVFTNNRLVMHVRECGDDEMKIPFHVGENRSRTWVVSRTPDGLHLAHDHRHDDGSEDEITMYGGATRGEGTASTQEFFADEHTAGLIPAAATNVWTMEVVPGRHFAYALRREGTDRRIRIEFDLTRPVEPPPAPWGHE